MAIYRLVEDYSTDDHPAILGDQTFPVPSVIEDEDGVRFLLVFGDRIPARVWIPAHAAGVALLVDAIQWGACTTEWFLDHRTEIPAIAEYEVGTWERPFLGTYRQHLTEQVADEAADPLDKTTFVHLHTHTEYSAFDGLSTMEEVVTGIMADGQYAFGTADHGNCAGHPEAQALADKHGLRAVLGMEAYFVPDRFRRSRSWVELDGVEVNPEHLTDAEKKKAERKSDAKEALGEYTHLTLWAIDETGLRNLWAMSTEAYRDGFYDGNARLDWDVLTRHAEGVVCGTGCLRGPVSRPLAEGDEDLARENLMRLHQIFGDRLYIEVHTNHLESQVAINHTLEQWSAAYQIPPLAVVDSHYSTPEHAAIHKTWVAMQTGKTLEQETGLFEGEQHYHLLTEAETRTALAYLPEQFVKEAMANTVEVARLATARVGGEVDTPTYSKASAEHLDPVTRDVERLIDVCLANWERKVASKGPEHEATCVARFEREMALLISKRYCGYFLIVWDYVTWAKREGCLVGPGRGSGGGSLVAYLADITEVDPVQADLLFERFLTEGRTSLPDFDIDFPTSWRPRLRAYLAQRWGEEYVANIGTVLRLRSKAAINDVIRALEPVLPYEVNHAEFVALKKVIDEADRPLAGKHLPWEDFCVQYADLVDPMREKYPEIFAMVDVVVDRVKSYGKHAAGVVISTSKPLTDLPMRLAEDKKTKTTMMVTQFDMNALELLGYVKFDLLTLRTLDTVQEAVDLIEAKFGQKIRPYDWVAEYEDPQVWEEIAAGKTLGLFQIETASGTRLTKRMQPMNLHDLAAVMTVVRPGPMRSGLTESYLRRRAGIEEVAYLDPRMEAFLGDTYGSMIYQEQVMATCMVLAGYDSTEADTVRSILGKKKVEKVAAAGEEFIRRAPEHGTDPLVAETLWAQMAEFAKYGFNKAHAFAYAVLGYWTAWVKFHFPVQFLTAALSTVDSDRLPEFIRECRQMGYVVVPPHINKSHVHFTAQGMEVVYGLANVKGIGEPTAAQIVAHAPYESLTDFVDRAVKIPGSAVNMGHLKILVEVGAFDSLVANRRATETQLAREGSGEARRCVHKIEAPNPEHPFNLPCSFDWAHEPDPPLLVRGRGKAKTHVPKPPPKRCSTVCRRYQMPAPLGPDDVADYTADELMDREKEMLGVWVTATPFDRMEQDALEASDTASLIEAGPVDTRWVGAAIVEAVRPKKDKTGKQYAFVTFNLQDGSLEAICFASLWEQRRQYLKPDALGVVILNKTSRGYNVYDYSPL